MVATVEIKGTVEEFVNAAYEILVDVRTELEEWRDNLPDSKRGGQKEEELDNAIDCLSQADEVPEVPTDLGTLPVQTKEILPKKTWGKLSLSKSSRISNALSRIEASINALSEKESDDATALVEQLQEHYDNFEATEIPHAFG